MSRQRSHCIIKKEDPDEINNNEEIGLYEKLTSRHSSKIDYPFGIKIPKFTGFKKDFPSKSKKPTLLFHEKAQIIGNFEKKSIGEIEEHSQMIDLCALLYQFKNEDEVKNLEVINLIDIDYEMLAELKNKAIEFIDATSILIAEKNEKGEEVQSEQALVEFLTEKYQEMTNNEINLQIFINNMENVKNLCYSKDSVKVFFKNAVSDK